MQIERIAIRLRRRTPWEALDLGHTMLRAWAAPACRAWIGTYWVVGLLLLAIFWSRQHIALLILWWLKPLFDRVLLFTYSRSLFGTPTRYRDVIAALPGILLHSRLLSGLTLRRLSLARSFLLPVWQLENQKGKSARQRFKVLSRRTWGNAAWLTFLCVHLNAILGISLVIAVELLTPGGLWDSHSFADWLLNDLEPEKEIVSSLLMMLAESVVEPLYVASGFSLYLHRRSELEGWDIELAFRRLAGRLAGAKAALGLAAGVALSLALALPPQPAFAEEAAPPAPPAASAPSPARQAVDKVLADPVFGERKQEMQWRLKPEPKKVDAPDRRWIKALRELLEFAGDVLRALGWITALGLAVTFIYLLMVFRERWAKGGRTSANPPDFLFGLDVRPASLPADIAAAALDSLAAGRIEQALSLLYRGALAALLHRLRVEFQPGDTEDNCQQRVRSHLDGAANSYFGLLLEAWRLTAYGHRPPATAVLEDLCRDWNRHFGPAGGKA